MGWGGQMHGGNIAVPKVHGMTNEPRFLRVEIVALLPPLSARICLFAQRLRSSYSYAALCNLFYLKDMTLRLVTMRAA